jgi:DNA primase small subunit
VREHLLSQWSPTAKSQHHLSPAGKWQELKTHVKACIKKGGGGGPTEHRNKVPKTASVRDRNRLETWCAETVFRHTYPRLDINVSKMRNHLLKSPFCVHPKTGRVCVPIRTRDVDAFDPFAVPTLPQILNELDQYEAAAAAQQNGGSNDDDGAKKCPDWQKTSLKGYYEPFEKEFLEPLAKQIRRANRDANEQQAALVGDF